LREIQNSSLVGQKHHMEDTMKRFSGFFSGGSLLACTLILSSGTALAATVTGVANGSGTVIVSASYVDFEAFLGGACGAGPSLGSPGCFIETSPTNGDFPLSGTQTIIKDLMQPAYPFVGAVGAVGLGQVVWSNGVTFDLTLLEAGGQPNCATLTVAQRKSANATCTFYDATNTVPGIFTLQNNAAATSVVISMNWLGNAYKGTNATSSLYEGAFSTQYKGATGTGATIDDVFNTIGRGGSIESSYSVTFGGAVPEPMTFALVGSGLLLMGFIGRKKTR
jgi:hypothetical protein